jgi:hypothetical protein
MARAWWPSLVLVAGLYIGLQTLLYPPSRCGYAGCFPGAVLRLYIIDYVVGGVLVLLGLVGLLRRASTTGR